MFGNLLTTLTTFKVDNRDKVDTSKPIAVYSADYPDYLVYPILMYIIFSL